MEEWPQETRCPALADSCLALAEYSVNATDWLLDSFLEDSDEVVVLRVIEPTSSAQTGFDAITKEARTEAESVLDYLMKKNGDERQVREPSCVVSALGSANSRRLLLLPPLADLAHRRVRYRSHRGDYSSVRPSRLRRRRGAMLRLLPPQHDRNLQARLFDCRDARTARFLVQVGFHGLHISVRLPLL